MGAEQSKRVSGGTLLGAYAPSMTAINSDDFNLRTTKIFAIKVPQHNASNRLPGDRLRVKLGVDSVVVPIPKGKKPGDRFEYTHTSWNVDRVIASTLPTIPGMEIVQSKPIVWGSVSETFSASGWNQQIMGTRVSSLMQEAQKQILLQVAKAGCNACLGMTFNITNDSSGERGNYKMVIVTACGTPCVVMPSVQQNAVVCDVLLEPLNNNISSIPMAASAPIRP